MLETIFAADADASEPPSNAAAAPPLCLPAIIAERTMLHGVLSLVGLLLVVAQALVNGPGTSAQPQVGDAEIEAAAPAAQCAAPLVTRQAFAAWADGLIARRAGYGK